MSMNWTVPAYPGFFTVRTIPTHGGPPTGPNMEQVETMPIIAWVMDGGDLRPVTSEIQDPMPEDVAIMRPGGKITSPSGDDYENLLDYARAVTERLKAEWQKD